jgi:hypothetical protein
VCLWIAKFDARLWAWIEHRVERFMHFVMLRKTDPAATLDEDAAAHIAFEIQDEWFPRDPRYPAVWGRKIAHLRPPAVPLMIEVWREDTTRCERFTEELFNGKQVYPEVLQPGDEWFARRWKPIHEEQKCGEHVFRIHDIRCAASAT